MESIWILGAGKFGRMAVERLTRANPESNITLIDQNPQMLQGLAGQAPKRIHADGIQFLVENLIDSDQPEWIVAAIPIHMAFEWIRIKLSPMLEINRIQIPAAVIARLPNALQNEQGTAYTSNAAFMCPDDCPEPAKICIHTGQPRPCNLYEELEALTSEEFESFVVRSHQLLPGVGGCQPGDLFQTLEKVKAATKPILLSTACRCHGVMDAFCTSPRKK
jgi:hypothetical protein